MILLVSVVADGGVVVAAAAAATVEFANIVPRELGAVEVKSTGVTVGCGTGNIL